MIVLCTDFGLEGPYTGQVKAVLARNAPAEPVIDLFADLRSGRSSRPICLPHTMTPSWPGT
jgi:S-adenosylmethionine hydrolase